MIRAFVAISIPEKILERIEQTSDQLRRLGLDARFTKVSSIHLTLRFLGDVGQSLLDDINLALERSTEAGIRFNLAIKGVGVFPSFRRPRIIWVGVGEDPLLNELQWRVETNLGSLGFETEKRAFKPHLTVARLKSSRNVSELQRFLEVGKEAFNLGSFEVGEVHLYQSLLHPEGAEYRRLATHCLPNPS